MPKFKIKFKFQERGYFHEVTAQNEYGALVAFWEEIKRKIAVEGVAEVKPPKDDLDTLLDIFGMKK